MGAGVFKAASPDWDPRIEFARKPVKCTHPLPEARLSPSVQPPVDIYLH